MIDGDGNSRDYRSSVEQFAEAQRAGTTVGHEFARRTTQNHAIDGGALPPAVSDAGRVAATSECDDSAETLRARVLEMPLAAVQADGDGREMTPLEPKNPAWTEPNSAWAGCPFDGDEAFNVSSCVGFIRAKATEHQRKGHLDEAARLHGMADKLSVTGKKVRERCQREAIMAAAQRVPV